jgi:murein DD-endopeptidase MepM/ murein hydrolase activator NlpD
MTEPNDAEIGCHYVLPGDTLSGIAIRHDTTVTELARLNNIQHPLHMRPHTWLLLPGAATHVDARHIAALNAVLRIEHAQRATDRLRPTIATPTGDEVDSALSKMDVTELHVLRDAARTLSHVADRAIQDRWFARRHERIEWTDDTADMAWPARVTLTRHLRSGGDVTTSSLTPARAREMAGRMLADNGAASVTEAKIWAAALRLGERITHSSGYAVTVTTS